MTDALWKKSASELARMIRQQEVSSTEVVKAHLARIEAVNVRVNAITVTLADSALAAAQRADNTEPTGPFHGVPFTIKENIDCVGSATTNGVPAFANAMPGIDSPVVARMKAAGAIPLARTNLPEMGLRVSTDNPLRGRTLNPWHPELVAGGSSGGEGAALATGMSPMGLGNDIGGSLRNPAYCCGIVSLKPSAGRIPHALSLPPSDATGLAGQIMAVEGPMARHVKDLQAMYKVLAGRDPRDPMSADVPLYQAPPSERCVALVTEIPGVSLPPAHIAAIKTAGQAMADAGWQVEEATPPDLEKIHAIWATTLSSEFEPILNDMRQIMSPAAVRLLEDLFTVYPAKNMPVPMLHGERWRLSVLWSAFFERYPLVIGPTWTDIPFRHDEDIQEDSALVTLDRLRFITPANLLGLPSAAVPTGIADGIPTGIQVMADRWQDHVVLEAAAVIEARCGQITPIDPVF